MSDSLVPHSPPPSSLVDDGELVIRRTDGSRVNAHALRTVIAPEVERLRLRNAGVTAENLVDAATPVESPLHPYLEWDDQVAGNEWRHHQARQLIRAVSIMVVSSQPDNSLKTRAYRSVRIQTPTPTGPETRRVYQDLATINGNPALRRQLLNEMRSRVKSLTTTLANLERFLGQSDMATRERLRELFAQLDAELNDLGGQGPTRPAA